MQVKDYMPHLYDPNSEMNAILDAETEEFNDNLKVDIAQSFKDTFVLTASIHGIENWEKLLEIIPDTNSNLEFRRKVVLNRLLDHIPFTDEYLKQRLDAILGSGNYEYVPNYDDYELLINMVAPGRTWYNELVLMLDKIVPCNIDWQINIYKATWQQVKDNFTTWNDLTTHDWQYALDGEYVI